MKSIRISFFARGHKNVLSTHKTTFEVTKDENLSKRGNCIVAVQATKAALDLPIKFKEAAKREGARIIVTIEVDGLKETVKAWGSTRLQFTHQTDLVVRKSSYVCDRTLAIRADKAAFDFSRELVEKLKNPKLTVKFTLTVEP
jgi:hypothetical protein